MTWTKRKSGWGTTEYTTTVDGIRYVAKKTGGRFLSWEVREDKWKDSKRIVTGGKLSSVKESFENHVRSAR